ncbi:copper homeostasis protein CutC [Mucilaginibacter roseus]|uniref:PF03932 family protein CutC n=1 Tax=Mucilaginibacter roseus TaxID=1528868 RepID=A0ABS8U2I7_9SPHI|nr:copper homeostasis protein CutC [Mucilaginibacter roseus]MCD8740057.1 copper homeostasis protein CutC [Mucilaginibacter roseus]
MVSLEVCANSVVSAVAAQEGGATRVELCDNLSDGGTTPSAGQIQLARKLLHIKIYVLIRPRGGDFLYNDVEFEIMKAEIRHCIEAGCDGVVIGMLTPEGRVDKPRCKELVDIAKQWGLGVTFHRAIDMSADIYQALEDIVEIGCERVLTSGGKTTAIEGASVIASLVQQSAGRISIMPGCGVDENNVNDIVRFTGAKEVHSTAKTRVSSQMLYRNDHILMGGADVDEYSVIVTNAERVRTILTAANNL